MIFFYLISLVWSDHCRNPFYQGEFLSYYQRSFAATRSIIIGDLHSDVSALRRILKFTSFSASDTLIALGDAIGRGNETKETLEYFMSSNNSLLLLGNHEHMNLNFKFDYVSENDLLSFEGAKNRIKAFAQGSKYWNFLTTRPAVVRLGDLVLVHAGVSLKLAQKYPRIEDINDKVMNDYEIFGPFGPLWFRAYAVRQEEAACPELTETLAVLKARFMLMGHSVGTHIRTRCKGKAVFLDTGISYAVNSTLSALEVIQIDGRTVWMNARYPQQQDLVVVWPVIDSQQCPNVYHEGQFLSHYQQTFGVDRLVLVGDLHSDASALQKIVFYTNVTKQDTFISLGDVLGYGNDTKEILQFFQKVPNSFHILGDEELYSLLNIGQELGKGDLESFGGYSGRIKAFSKGGAYWDYLTTRPLVLKFGDFLATHAGVSLALASNYSNIEDLNQDFIINKYLTGPFGPTLYSNYADWPENATCPDLYETLEKTRCKFMIMSHIWFPSISTRCRGRSVFLHTGISQSFNSSLSALEVLQSEGRTVSMRALYPGRSEELYSLKVY